VLALTKLQEDLPEQITELRERFPLTSCAAAEGYLEAATGRYNELVERGEAALDRLRSQSAFEDASARAQASVDQAVELTQEALAPSRRRPARSVSVPPSWSASSCPEGAAKKAAAKKAPAKKAAARRRLREGSGKKVTQK